MDELGIITLQAEIEADLDVLLSCAKDARKRFNKGLEHSELESTAYQLVRFYNIIEQACLRIAKAFENHIDNDKGWHTELIKRLSLEIPGVRPPFFGHKFFIPKGQTALRELRGFRHVVVHSYDLTISRDKILEVLKSAEFVADNMKSLIKDFFSKVKKIKS